MRTAIFLINFTDVEMTEYKSIASRFTLLKKDMHGKQRVKIDTNIRVEYVLSL